MLGKNGRHFKPGIKLLSSDLNALFMDKKLTLHIILCLVGVAVTKFTPYGLQILHLAGVVCFVGLILLMDKKQSV